MFYDDYLKALDTMERITRKRGIPLNAVLADDPYEYFAEVKERKPWIELALKIPASPGAPRECVSVHRQPGTVPGTTHGPPGRRDSWGFSDPGCRCPVSGLRKADRTASPASSSARGRPRTHVDRPCVPHRRPAQRRAVGRLGEDRQKRVAVIRPAAGGPVRRAGGKGKRASLTARGPRTGWHNSGKMGSAPMRRGARVV